MPSSEHPWRRRWSDLKLFASSSSSSSPSSSSFSLRRSRGATKPSAFLNGWHDRAGTMFSDSTKRRFRSIRSAVQEHRATLQPYAQSFSFKAQKTAQRTYRMGSTAASYADQLLKAQLETMSWVQAMIAVCLGALLLLLVFLVLARSQSGKRMAKVRRGVMSTSSSEKRSLMSVMEDSDERDDFEDEDDEVSGAQESTDVGVMKRFRSALSSRRRGMASLTVSEKQRRRPNSIIRITSSDPRSRLSVHAMQMDLDPQGSQLRSTSSYRGSASNTDHTSTNASVTRRRRDSGRLATGTDDAASTPTSAASSSSSSSSTVSSPLPRNVHTAARAAKQRRFARGSLDQDRRRSMDNTIGRRSSMSSDDGRSSLLDSPSSMHSFSSAVSGSENPWSSSIYGNGPLKLASILRREPQFYASLPQLPLLPLAGAEIDGSETAANDPSTAWRHPVAPSSTSSSSTDTHVDPNAFNVLPPTSTQQSCQSRLPPGAGRPGCSPLRSNSGPVRLGSLTPDQMKAIWPDKKLRTVKLREPDWSPYASVHERARERMEKYAELLRSESPMGGAAGSSTSEEGSATSSHLAAHETDETFWYEKYTRSTAASGRDWDWRKRRARQAALRRAASLDSMKPLPNEPEQIASRTTSIANGSSNVNEAPNTSTRSNTSPRLEVNVNGDGLDFNSAVFPYSNSSPVKVQDDSALSAPGFTPNRRNRSFSDIDQRDADKAMSVPGRLSSLKPKGGVRRMLSRRDKGGGVPTSPLGRRASDDRHSPPRPADLQTTPNGWTRSLELTTGDGRSITADAALRQHGSLRKSTSLANLNPAFVDSAPDLHDARRTAVGRAPQPLRQVSPLAVNASQQEGAWMEMKSAWSSADAYGTAPPLSSKNVTPRQNGTRSNSLFATPEVRNRDSVVIPPDLASMYGKMMFSNAPPPNQPLPPLPRTVSASATADSDDRPIRPQRRGTEPNSTWTRPALSGQSITSQSAQPTTGSGSDLDRRPGNPSKRAIVANARSAFVNDTAGVELGQ